MHLDLNKEYLSKWKLLLVLLQLIILFPLSLGYYIEIFVSILLIFVLLFFLLDIKNGIILLPLFLYLPFTIPSTDFQLSEISILLILFIFLVTILIDDRNKSIQLPGVGVFLFIIFTALLSLINAKYTIAGIKNIIRMIEAFIFILYLLYNYLDEREHIFKSLVIIVFSGVIAAIHGIYQFKVGGEYTLGFERRIFGLQGGGYGAFIGTSIICALSLMMFSKLSKLYKIIILLCIPILIIALILHQTRAWYGGTFIAFLFLLSNLKRKKNIFKLSIVLLIIGIFVFIILKTNLFNVVPKNIVQSAQETSMQLGFSPEQNKGKYISGLSRLFIWWKGFQIFSNHPIFGFGIGNLRFKNMLTGELGNPSNEHCGFIDNQYLNVLYETGIIGSISWLILIYVIIKKSRKLLTITQESDWKAIILAIIGSLIVFFTGGIFWCITVTHEMIVLLAFMIGLLFLCNKIQNV